MTRGLLIILVTVVSCTNDRQEPIFHLFKSSTEYPNYLEVDFVKGEGFRIDSLDSKKTLTLTSGDIEVMFLIGDNEELETKITRDYLNSFDTLLADKEIKDFGGQRTLAWRSEDDSTK